MTSNFRKATITILLTVCMAISMFAVTAFAENTDSTSTNADSTSVNHTCEKEVVEYTATQAAKYIAGDNTYPKLEGYLFAGWYNNDSCKKEDAIAGGTPSGGKAFALFVPEHVLSIQAQVSKNLIDDNVSTDADAKGSLRFITSVDSLLYKQVGFEVYYTANGVTRKATSASNKVYSKLYEIGSTNEVWKKTPSDVFCNVSKYFKICTLKNFTMETYMETEFTVKPYWITLDDDKVYGVEATKSFEEGCLRDTVYVAEGGVDEPNYGGYNNPYGTLDYAISHVLDGGTVRVKTALTVDAWGDEHGKSITITGNGENDDVTETDSLQLETITFTTAQVKIYDDTTFEKINIVLSNAEGDFNAIFAEGNHLKIAESVEITNQLTQLQIFGGSDQVVENTNLELYAGTYDRIYGGGYADVLGNTYVTIGGTVNKDAKWEVHNDRTNLVFGGCYGRTVHGDTNVTIESGAKANYIFGAGETANSRVLGDTNIVFEGQAYAIYGGSAAGTNADTHITMKGGKVYQIFGGCESNSMTGNTDVKVLGGTVGRRIYGGCYNDDANFGESENCVTGYTSVSIGTDADVALDMDNSRLDNSLSALTRAGTVHAGEKGVFIFNDYKQCSTNIGKIGHDWAVETVGISTKTHDYQVNATSGGTVSSAGDCIYIKPDNADTAATVTINGNEQHYTEEASYYPLPAGHDASVPIVVEFGAKKEISSAYKAQINSVSYYLTLEEAIAAAEKMENATITNLDSTKQFASISIIDSNNGTVTTDKKNCIVGQTVTLIVTPDEGYNLTGLTVKKDGETVDVGITTSFAGGEYVFTPEAGAYTVQATFERKIFAEQTGWDVTTQYDGKVTLNSGRTGNSKWLNLYDTYGDMDMTLTVRDCIGVIDDKPEVSSVVKLTFGDKFAAFRIGCFKKDSTQSSADVYKVQSYGGPGSLYAWSDCGALTEEEVAAYQSEQGLKFRLVRSSTDVFLYVGDRRVCEAFDLRYTHAGAETYITAATKATVSIKQDGNFDSTDNPFAIEIPFELSTVAPEKVTIALPNCENGSFNIEFKKYLAGDSVKLTVNGDSGYYYDSLSINEEDIIVDWDGTHTFEAEEYYYKVTGSFAPEIFNASANWHLINQNVGVLKPAGTVDTGYMETKGNYSVVSITLKNENRSVKPFGLGTRLDFANGQYLSIQIYGSAGGRYVLKSCHGAALYGNGNEYYVLTSNQVTALETTGLDFKMVRCGTNLMFYLAGERLTELKVNGTVVDCLDLAHDYVADDGKTFLETPVSSGVDENTKAIFKIRSWSTPVEIPFALSNDVPATVSFDSSQSTNGTVTSNLGVCLVGDTVTLTATPNEGYDCTGLVIDGTDVTENAVLNENGTCTYTFKATKESYTVEPIYKQIVNVNITQAENGTISTTETKYYVGDTVTLVVAGDADYYYDSLTINGDEVMIDNDGTYTFTTTESVYNVVGSFAKSRFDTSGNALKWWNLTNQHKGVVVQTGNYDGASSSVYLNFANTDQHVDSDVSILVKKHVEAEQDGCAAAIGYYKGNMGGDKGFRIVYDKDTQTYSFGHASSKYCGGTAWIRDLTEEETSLITDGAGLEFRVVRSGTQVAVYLDGRLAITETLPYSDTDTTGIWLKRFDDKDVEVEMPFTMSASAPESVNVTTSTDSNGTITLDKSSYIIGEKVTLTIAGEDGYFYNSLKVDGTEVIADADGKYTFTATKTYHTVEASFAEAIFNSSTNWNVINQNVGILRAPATSKLDKGWVSTTSSYNEAAVTVKDFSGGTETFGVVVRFYFSNYKHISIRLVNEVGTNNGWVLQSEGGIYGYKIFYNLNTIEIGKVTGEGIEFKMVRTGTTVDLYLDGEKVVSGIDLTANNSGITAEMTAALNFKLYGNNNLVTEIPFTLSKGWITSYQGKYVSILGDSISTYEGISNVGTTNTTIAGYNAWYNGDWKDVLESEDETYWGQVISKYQMNLLVNNSCGGNRLMDASGTNVTAPAGYMRVEELAANTGELNGTKPDIILINMGTNDYIKGRTLGEHNDATYTGVVSDTGYKTPETFTEAYIITLEKAKTLYPDAKICCFTLLPTSYNTDWDTLNAYNTRIREIVAHYEDVTLVDIANDTGITTSNYTDYTFDGTHPNLNGISAIATIFERALLGIEQ